MKRRSFLAASCAMLAAPSWAALDSPRLISAAADGQGGTWIVGLSDSGTEAFRLAVPGRGHAAAAHPERAEAVAFARRPGNFALVIDCVSGREVARLETPEGLHFYGHGAFTADGALLLTTENAFDVPDGRIGLWDAAGGYRRIGDLPSGGLGPHEIIRLTDGAFAVANGGIRTHPDFGRRKLNVPQMRTNLAYLSAAAELTGIVEPDEDLRQNSIRHIAADSQDRIAIATQWQGDPTLSVPLVASHRRGEAIAFHDHPEMARLAQYAGSVAVGQSGGTILVTGPKGDRVLRFSGADIAPAGGLALPVASGVAAIGEDFIVTASGGLVRVDAEGRAAPVCASDLIWDNHLVAI